MNPSANAPIGWIGAAKPNETKPWWAVQASPYPTPEALPPLPHLGPHPPNLTSAQMPVMLDSGPYTCAAAAAVWAAAQQCGVQHGAAVQQQGGQGGQQRGRQWAGMGRSLDPR